jgi:DNA invertase Pin-like site-specific DNA recombinase
MTEERPSIEVLIRDCKTKSEQIRKLAESEYSRTDIAKALGIRYQHVRNVPENSRQRR